MAAAAAAAADDDERKRVYEMEKENKDVTSSASSSASSSDDAKQERENELEEESRNMRRALPPDILDLILSWTLDDISNEYLYNDKVDEIPQIFKSASHCLGSFVFPLIEEVRADICSSFQIISKAPSSEIIYVQLRSSTKKLYDVKVHSWKNESNSGVDKSYRPASGDILVLTNVRPESMSDLHSYGSTCLLASVTNVIENGESDSDFEVRVANTLELSDGMQKSLFAIFLVNVTTYNRTWQALGVHVPVMQNLNIIKEVLYSSSSVGEICKLCDSDNVNNSYLPVSQSELNDSQVNAVLDSISQMQCNDRCSVKLIWGPPGTGKTKTITELLWMLLLLKHNALTCGPTNVSVLEVSSRLLKLVKRNRKSTFCHLLGDIILYGHKRELKLSADDDLNQIYLDYRVDRLVECFDPMHGWKRRIKVLVNFLEDSVRQYQMHLGQESSEGCERDRGDAKIRDDDAVQDKRCSTFLPIFTNRFRELASSLGSCIKNLCTHLPIGFLSSSTFDSMVTVLNLLEDFGNLLSRTGVDDKELEGVLRLPVVQGEENTSYSSNLLSRTQRKCIEKLNILENSLQIPLNCSKAWIRDLCLKSALLIFCNATTSFDLLGLKSLDFLVIDEASQMKECESAIPLQLAGIRHAILAGDECQLPATVKSKVSQEASFGRSLFERLSSLGHPKHLLNVQYRMHPSICLFPNNKFYAGRIINDSSVANKKYEICYLPGRMYGPYSFINVSDGREEIVDSGHSRWNLVEVAVVLRIVHDLFKARSGKQGKLSVGIVSLYSAQLAFIQDKVGKYNSFHDNFVVKVKSVEDFQGGEEDLIIISTVRSNCDGSIGFLSNPQIANIILTRARHCLWIIGDSKTLIRSRSIWEALVRDAEYRQCFFNVDEDLQLSTSILTVKEELDQIDDLLNMDSVIFRSARWKVLFGDNFKRSFTKIESAKKKTVISLLLKLAGGWRPRNYNAVVTCESSKHIITQYKMVGLYVICTIDIAKHTQVLKIWDILPLFETGALIKRLDSLFAMYTDDYITHCKMKRLEGRLEVPMSWGRNVDIIQYKSISQVVRSDDLEDGACDGRNYAENSKVSESLLLMKFYCLSSGIVGHLLSGRDGRELELPFEVTTKEHEIIIFPRSAFILGRSGTGKTTILTMKLIQREQQHSLSHEGSYDPKTCSPLSEYKKHKVGDNSSASNESMLRQLFVTVGSKLCTAVKNHISRLKSFTCGGDYMAHDSSFDMLEIDDTMSEFADIPDSFSKIQAEHYPLILTFQKFLVMLDGSMENSFFGKFHDLWGTPFGERGLWKSPAFHAFIRQREVNYDRFASVYWPHFNNHLTKRVDSLTVYKEIISHIKGGSTASEACDVLSKSDYIRMSESRSSTLSSEIRGLIYEFFLDYEKKKLINGDFDLSDFVIDLHQRLKASGGYFGAKMDFIYVDEVQDLTMRQVALFKYVCRNFSEGFVFAGDTAQTIARGIDFRFQDIRSLFYTQFLSESKKGDTNKGKDKDSISDIFYLNQNFRTHAGVLKLSQSVVDLLYGFFPVSVDRLSLESSLIYGEAPLLLESNDENAIVTIFGNCGSKGGGSSSNGFGAEQVILVRDDSSRQEVSVHVGKQALVLTILECKGLEFQDVLLYNFFGSSPMRSQWRVIYSYMNSHNLLDLGTSRSFPCFETTRHSVLCSELKQLYVAITRTRQRLWICETSEENAKPMFDYWKKLCLVQTRQLDGSLAEALRVASSNDEWRDRGTKLFREGNYEMATMCYERAGDVYREKLAEAAGLRASGSRILESNFEMGQSVLSEAAEIYEAIGKVETAALCYIELKEYKRAGLIYMEKCGESRLEDAGDCFSKAGCLSLAAEVYGKGKSISKCLTACSKGKLFDLGLNFIECWKMENISQYDTGNNQSIDENKNSFLESCALHYHRLNDKRNMMRFIRSFTSIERMRHILKAWDYLDEIVSIEDEHGNFKEAAEIARMKGDLLLEANMLEKAELFEDATRLILFHVVINSLWTSGSKGWPLAHFDGKKILLEKVKSLAERCSLCFCESVTLEACLLTDSGNKLMELAKYFNDARSLEHFRAIIFSVRKILDVHLQEESSEFQWEKDPAFDTMTYEDGMTRQGKPSLACLMFAWNFWKEKVAIVLECLKSLEVNLEDDFMSCKTFCLEYFGVRKQSDQKYVVVNSGAAWIKETDCKSLHKTRYLIYVEVHPFAAAAIRYWERELLSIGTKVLKKLKALCLYSERSLSHFYPGLIPLQIFEVSKYLMELKLRSQKININALDGFLTFSKERFFQIVFPFDWRRAMMKNMISLRESDSAMRMQKLMLAANMNNGYAKSTFGKIARSVMLLFGIWNPDEETYLTIGKCFEACPPWKIFIEEFKRCGESCSEKFNLVVSLHGALRLTFAVDRRYEVDYISPHCFLYLVERLLFFTSSCQSYYFTTKSSVIEAMMNYRSWNAISGSSSRSDPSSKHILKQTFDSIANMVQRLLLQSHDTIQWLRKFKLNGYQHHQLVVLRLFSIVGLVYLNSELHFVSLLNLLRRSDVFSKLPPQFYRSLKDASKEDFLDKFKSALDSVEDPLMIVDFRNNCSQMSRSNILVINKEKAKAKDEMCKVLFPKKLEDVSVSHRLGSSAKNSLDCVCPGLQNVQSKGRKLSTDPDIILDASNTLTEVDSKKQVYGKFWSTLELWQSECIRIREAGNFASLDSHIKVDIKEALHVLVSVLKKTLHMESVEKDMKELVEESKIMLDEIIQLFDEISASEVEYERKLPIIEELLWKLCGRKPRLQPLLDSLNLGGDRLELPKTEPTAGSGLEEVKEPPDNGRSTSDDDKHQLEEGRGETSVNIDENVEAPKKSQEKKE